MQPPSSFLPPSLLLLPFPRHPPPSDCLPLVYPAHYLEGGFSAAMDTDTSMSGGGAGAGPEEERVTPELVRRLVEEV